MRWRYERGEGRHKHRWKNDYAGFQPDGKGAIGKCPKHINNELAEQILSRGIPDYDLEFDAFPARIYAVYLGVIYEAVPTTPGSSYHAYPWRGDLPGRDPMPDFIKTELEKRAKKSGYLSEFKQWLRKYG